jgi:hypothetical protein
VHRVTPPVTSLQNTDLFIEGVSDFLATPGGTTDLNTADDSSPNMGHSEGPPLIA